MEKMEISGGIDEGLYSRQLYVLGHEAMQRMAGARVLIMGVGGLGIEIAKNIVLAGVKSVTLLDKTLTSYNDLASQFYLTEADIGQPRDLCSIEKLSNLNQYVPVNLFEGNFTVERLIDYQVVVVTETPLAMQLEINTFTRAHNIKFVVADIRGLFGMAFCDFGEEFVVHDVDGETPNSGMLAAISKDKDGVVAVLEDTRHRLEDGDLVRFTEVKGMTELNNTGPYRITVTGPHTFKIGDTSAFSAYTSGGLFTKVKVPKTLNFKSLSESLANPDFVISDYAKFDRPSQLHVGFQALDEFVALHQELPRSWNKENADEVVALAEKIVSKMADKIELDSNLIRQLAFTSRGSLAPMAAVIGGLVAQEALKAISGKFHPIHQYFYFDSLESLPKNLPSEESCQPKNTRYDSQIAVFGYDFQQEIRNNKQFLVGSGAIGCEMLKNWAMMGIGSGPSGKIHVTDMDTIEKSNLNRQFLFRPKDVGRLKSETAASAIIAMNPELSGKILSYQDRVGPDSENIYGDSFFDSIDMVTNALDNVEARTYMDRRCVYYHKPLLESGTSGTKGNTQVVVPRLTESYSASQDPPEKTIPMCTLKNFPNAIEHTIQWARDLFEGLFKQTPENAKLYMEQPDFVSKTLQQGGHAKEILEGVLDSLTTSRPQQFKDCVAWARLKFEELYYNTISQLLYNFPADSVTSTGAPFWSGPKRVPTPLKFNNQDPVHLSFINAAANLRAFNFGIKGTADVETIKQCVGSVNVPEFVPRSGVKIQVNENEGENNPDGDRDDSLEELIASLPGKDNLNLQLSPSEFEKDDDTNFHMEFVTAASNLRARNYGIAEVDRHATKGIAGKIIPAIATTTSFVTGLVNLELYKLIGFGNLPKRPVEDFKNGFVNLAIPFFGFSEPILAAKMKYLDKEFTQWDRFEIDTHFTLQGLLDYFSKNHCLDVSMISAGNAMLYSSFTPAAKLKERKPMKILDLVESISKQPVPPHVKFLVLEIVGDSLEGEEIEDLPYVKIRVRD